MDRGSDWLNALDRSSHKLQLPQAQVIQIKSSLILQPKRKSSIFDQFAGTVAKSIAETSTLIQSQRKGYLSSSAYSNSEKDQLEVEIGLCVKSCSKQIDRLKASVLVAQESKGNDGRPVLNGQAAAHLHGVVLVLAENLQRVAFTFDDVRMQRYRQKIQDEHKLKQIAFKAPRPSVSHLHERPDISRGGSASFTGSAAQQQLLADENKSLAAHLTSTAQKVLGIEQAVLEISTLNQLFSAAISSQAQAIEATYDNAVMASVNMRSGNEHLGKAISLNRSTQYYIVVLLAVATCCLLFFDWFHS